LWHQWQRQAGLRLKIYLQLCLILTTAGLIRRVL
jgi:hypothetical protein